MRLLRRTLPVATVLLVGISSPSAQSAASFSGHWEGKIHMPSQPVVMSLDLAQGPTGTWIGSVSFPNSTDVPLNNISVADGTVRFAAAMPGSPSFEAALSADGANLSGKASNTDGSVAFELTRQGEANVKVPPPSSPLSKEFDGMWEGAVSVDGQQRRIVLKLSPGPDGTARGLLISVDRGNQEIPVTTVTLQDKELQLDARSVGGSYRGTLGADGQIAGEWTQGPTRLPLTFKRGPSGEK